MSTIPPEEPGDREPRSEDDLWAEIVANYGDSPELPQVDHTDSAPPASQAGEPGVGPTPSNTSTSSANPPTPGVINPALFDSPLVPRKPEPLPSDEEGWSEDDPFLPGTFVAPEPAPLRWTGWNSAAWVGVLGAPVLALIWTIISSITGWNTPTLGGYAVLAAFLGGFGYLVYNMRKAPEDPWDDGARV